MFGSWGRVGGGDMLPSRKIWLVEYEAIFRLKRSSCRGQHADKLTWTYVTGIMPRCCTVCASYQLASTLLMMVTSSPRWADNSLYELRQWLTRQETDVLLGEHWVVYWPWMLRFKLVQDFGCQLGTSDALTTPTWRTERDTRTSRWRWRREEHSVIPIEGYWRFLTPTVMETWVWQH